MTVFAFDLGHATVTIADMPATEGEAHSLVDEIVRDAGGGLVAMDLETAPRPAEAARLRRLRDTTTKCNGVVVALLKAKAAPARIAAQKDLLRKARAALKYADKAGLDPHRADIRLLQLYGGGRRAAVIDLARTGPAILQRLNDLRLVAHNASFDLGFLAMHGVEPAEVHCTQQACRLTLGPDSTSLASAAISYLGVELDKDLQTSDWAAEYLTSEQVRYAAQDAITCLRIAHRVLPALREQAGAYEIQMLAVPATMRMELRGLGFDIKSHSRLMNDLRQERLELAQTYIDACKVCGHPELAAAGVPSTPRKTESVLTTLLSSEELVTWARTEKSGQLSTRRSELKRAMHYAPIAALVEHSVKDKALSSFDSGLSAQVSPVTGRIHAHYSVAGTVSGRVACKKPNLQQIPRDRRFRALFVPAAGKVFVGADYNLMEMRAAAHTSGDPAMTAAFERGDDLHRIVASEMLSKPPDEVTLEERKAAKAVNFGALYGQGPRGLMASAWDQFGVVLTRSEADSWIRVFERTYPTFVRWRRTHADRCEERRLIVIGRDAASGRGRFYPRSWLPKGASLFTRACNLPIQGACADAAMLALAYIDRMLFEEGIEGGPVAWVHDEILLEVPEADVNRASILLVKAMTDAFAKTFPGAPLNKLVEAKVVRNWAEMKD